MRRIVISVCAVLMAAVPHSYAQKFVEVRDVLFTQGSMLYSATASFIDNGILLGNDFSYDTPTVRLRGEIAFKELPSGFSFGAGFVLGYASGTERYVISDQVGWDSENSTGIWADVEKSRNLVRLLAGPSLSAHYAVDTRLDVYARCHLCYDFGGIADMSKELGRERSRKIQFDYGLAVGAEYFLTDRIGVLAEAGLTSQWLNVGIVVSFGRNIVSDFFYRTPKHI